MKLEYTIYVDAKPEKVWEALVSPTGTKAAFFGSELQSSFEEGEPFQYVGPNQNGETIVHVYGHILSCESYRKLAYLEHPGPSYYEQHAELTSRIVFELEEAGSTTKVTLINDEWSENHPGVDNSRAAWPMVLSSVKTWCETGATLNFGW